MSESPIIFECTDGSVALPAKVLQNIPLIATILDDVDCHSGDCPQKTIPLNITMMDLCTVLTYNGSFSESQRKILQYCLLIGHDAKSHENIAEKARISDFRDQEDRHIEHFVSTDRRSCDICGDHADYDYLDDDRIHYRFCITHKCDTNKCVRIACHKGNHFTYFNDDG